MTDTERERINAICEVAGVTEIDDLSDGFHTFRQLYYQRMMLFAVIVKQNKDKAWKSLRHEDGELCFGGGWFIVGIDTPEGGYTYHYEDDYYSLFDCEELERGKHWDGHTEKDVTRLLSLQRTQLSQQGTTSDLIDRQMAIDLFPDDDLEYDTKGGYVAPHLARRMIEELPSAQPEPTQEIQDILDYLDTVLHPIVSPEHWDVYSKLHDMVSSLPSAQPDGIPLEWIDKHLEWLDNCDNDFAQLSKVSIKAMVELWKKDMI